MIINRVKVYGRKLAIPLGLTSLVLTLMILIKPSPTYALPATFMVTNTNPSGGGSLRQAIINANTNNNPTDQDIINFNIAQAGNLTITPTSQISITQSVLINGYTQNDSRPTTTVAPYPFDGILRVAIDNSQSGALTVTGDNVTLQGLNIMNGEDGNISVESADGFKLFGSYLDTLHDGLTPGKSLTGEKSLIIEDSANVKIGGELAIQRNLFGYCSISCISASGSPTSGLEIKGNYIGLGADGIAGMGSLDLGGAGIDLFGGVSNALIGGLNPASGNSVEHNYRGGIQVQDGDDISVLGNRVLANYQSDTHGGQGLYGGIFFGGVTNSRIGSSGGGRNIISGNYAGSIGIDNSSLTGAPSTNINIEDNYIGVMDNGISPFSNYLLGLRVSGDSDYVLIKDNSIKNTTKLLNDTPGVFIDQLTHNVAVINNSIYNNQGVGIKNDSFEATGMPGYTQIVEDGGDTIVEYTINVPAGDYRIEFFKNTLADASGPGEGETFVGFDEITTDGGGLERFSTSLSGVNLDNLSLTATEIDSESPNGFGMTSEFNTIGEPYVPEGDFSTSLSLENPEDVRLGQTLNFAITVTNNGPDAIDIGAFNGSVPGQNDLVENILPPELEYQSVTGANISCTDLGPGSAGTAVTYLSNHADHSLVLCSYTGGTNILNPGQSVSFVLNVEVVDLTSSGFETYLIGGIHIGDPNNANIQSIKSNGELIDNLYYNSVNNFSKLEVAPVPIDLATSTSVINPEDFALGQTLNFAITVTNNGPDAIDIGAFNGSVPGQNDLVENILPPELEYQSVTGANISCTDLGPGSAGTAVTYLSNHADHSLVLCSYTGGTNILNPGQSVSFVLNVEVVDETGMGAYLYTLGGVHVGDPDEPEIRNTLENSELINAYNPVVSIIYGSAVVNNFSSAFAREVDGEVAMTANNPESIGSGMPLNFTLSFTNNGPSQIDLTYYDSATQNPIDGSIFTLIVPPLFEYVSSDNPEIECTSMGEGSSALTPWFGDHVGYSLLLCKYVGSDTSMLPNEHIQTQLSFNDKGQNRSFDIHAIGGISIADSSSFAMLRAMYGGVGGDILGYFRADGTNNYAYTEYSLPSSGQGIVNQAGELLSSTGDNIKALVVIASLLSIGSVVLIAFKVRGRTKKEGKDE